MTTYELILCAIECSKDADKPKDVLDRVQKNDVAKPLLGMKLASVVGDLTVEEALRLAIHLEKL